MTSTTPRPWLSTAYLLAAVLIIAVNLRPVLTSLGPVLHLVKADTGLSDPALGALGAVPIVIFALVSPLVSRLLHRFDIELTMVGALSVLVIATIWRALPGLDANLWLGTALAGAAIAVTNVAMPALVKRDFPFVAPRVTSVYVAALSIFSGLGSGLAVPLAQWSSYGWRFSLGAWAILGVLALLLWVPRALQHPTRRSSAVNPRTSATTSTALPTPSVWRRALAWQLAMYMGLQSAGFFVMVTWLPSIEQDLGVPAETAGWHLFVLQVLGLVGNLTAPLLMRLGADERLGAMIPGLTMITGSFGLILAPQFVWAWAGLIGYSTGSAFVIALTLMAQRAPNTRVAGQLSGMSQAVGYALAGGCLVVAGWLRGVGNDAVLLQMVVIGGAIVVVGLLVGRHRMVFAAA